MRKSLRKKFPMFPFLEFPPISIHPLLEWVHFTLVQTNPQPKSIPIERDLKGTVFAPLRLWEKGPGDEGKPHRYEIHPIYDHSIVRTIK
jgi:hypothetical protein